MLDPHGETLAFGSAGDGVQVFSYPAGYAGRGVEAREPNLFSSLCPTTVDGHGLSPMSSAELKGCMSLRLGVLAAVKARVGVT